MKIVTNKIILIIGCLFILSCNDYLDVKKEDSLLEKDLFSNEKGIQTALNGVYISMADAKLYGENLTMGFTEVLGQLFKSSRSSEYNLLSSYSYKSVEQIFTGPIWNKMYATILDINNFLKRLKKDPAILSGKHQKILEGEAYGLRAMLHFDLLRLFGPVYVKNPKGLSIPYRDEVTPNDKKRLPASEVMKKILSDLTTAENLLKDDPIRKYGTIAALEENIDKLKATDPILDYDDADFYRFRNLRMNYYAVKALQARVNLYAGNKQEALTAAKVVIDEGEKWFPWTTEENLFIRKRGSRFSSKDKLFFKELIFSLPNPRILETYKNTYSEDLNYKKILLPEPTRLRNLYDSRDDYRYKLSWVYSRKIYKQVFSKFNQKDMVDEVKDQQPLIRLSEMYYIAAETATNPANALAYLNTVRIHRGLKKMGATNDLKKEIMLEYKREFYGEGQLFFYYKRLNYDKVPNGSSRAGTINMNDSKYVIPVPFSEAL